MRVVPDVAAIRRRFDYSVPPGFEGPLEPGSRVRIDLHGRRVGAWVVEADVAPTEGVEAKPLAASSGIGPPPRWWNSPSGRRGDGPARSPPSSGPPRHRGWSARSRSLAAVRPRRHDGLTGQAARSGWSGAHSTAPGPAVVRLAPALDAALVVLELVHRVGPAGVLALAPSHLRAEQLATRLEAAGAPVALLPGAWQQAAAGGAVAVGTRATAWAPLPRLAATAVLDAHDEAYREERAPTWSAIDVVLERARRDGAPAILVSPCPTVVLVEGSTLVATERAVERRGWPRVEVVDRRGDDPRTGLFSERLVPRPGRCSIDLPGVWSACSTGPDGCRSSPAASAGRSCAAAAAAARWPNPSAAARSPATGARPAARRCVPSVTRGG